MLSSSSPCREIFISPFLNNKPCYTFYSVEIEWGKSDSSYPSAHVHMIWGLLYGYYINFRFSIISAATWIYFFMLLFFFLKMLFELIFATRRCLMRGKYTTEGNIGSDDDDHEQHNISSSPIVPHTIHQHPIAHHLLIHPLWCTNRRHSSSSTVNYIKRYGSFLFLYSFHYLILTCVPIPSNFHSQTIYVVVLKKYDVEEETERTRIYRKHVFEIK